MWLIEYIPNWIVHLALIVAIGAVVVSRLIPVLPNRTLITLGAAFTVLLCVFIEGSLYNEDKWKLRVAAAEKRALEAEVKSSQENVKLVTKTVEKIQVVKDVEVVIQKEIVERAVVIDAECRIPREAIDIHNKAAKRPEGVK